MALAISIRGASGNTTDSPFLGGETMLIMRFNLKDIKDYEVMNRCSILEMLSDISVYNLIEIVRLGNANCDAMEAGAILDKYLETHTLADAYTEIRDSLMGRRYIKEEYSTEVEASNFKSLTDLYQKLGVDLRTYADLGYSEFWGMSVDDMFLEFNIMNDKVTADKQDKINDLHLQALMIGQAVWGKLSAEAPKLNNQRFEEETEGEFAGMDPDTIKSLLNLKAFQKIHNQEVKDNG